jgi:hypothetical protein
MRYNNILSALSIAILLPIVTIAQTDSTTAKKDSLLVNKVDTTALPKSDSMAMLPMATDTAVIAVPMNCYKQWIDYFNELGSKPVTDGSHTVVIAFKSKESCHCYMGKVEVANGKIKAPVLVQTEGGDYKSFLALGKKMHPDFLEVVGDGLWEITNGMSVVFQTTDNEYGRIFFYKSLNKNKQMSKEAPSPSELLKN